jgi:hypothetical protein
VQATAAVAALGTGWCVAYLKVGAGTEAFAYVFVPIAGALATASVHHLSRSDLGLDPVARRFWRAVLLAVGVITIGYAWLAVDMLTHAAQARTRSMPVSAAACVAIGFVIAIWALARVPVVATGGVERWRMVLDRTIAFLGCCGRVVVCRAWPRCCPPASRGAGRRCCWSGSACWSRSVPRRRCRTSRAARSTALRCGSSRRAAVSRPGSSAVLAVQFGYIAVFRPRRS